MSVEHLRFAAYVLKRLGEELNPHPDQGIIELVKNAYDADANKCQIELIRTSKKGGTVRIQDDGTGMDDDDIRNGWLMIGRSPKPKMLYSPIYHRHFAGNKGLGRLAALRLGTEVKLVTRPREEPDNEYEVLINWSRFENADAIESVGLELVARSRQAKTSGTVIEITNLHAPLTKADVQRLARAMILLSDPFQSDQSFRPVLAAPEFKTLEELVRHQYFDEADFVLQAELDDEGRAKATVKDFSGKTVFAGSHADICRSEGKPLYNAPRATFALWAFLLGGKAKFVARSASMKEIRQWLGVVGGVHFYHRGLCVQEYSNYDWLEMNLRRVQSPELTPSTNTSVGRMVVDDPESRLLPKTDRSGFIERIEFRDLKRFASDALRWMATQRLKERERGREVAKKKAAKRRQEAKELVNDALAAIPAESRSEVEEAVKKYERALTGEADAIREELQLYRTLSTVGAAAATFAHETKQPFATIQRYTRELRQTVDRFCDAGGTLFPREVIYAITEDMLGSCESLLCVVNLTLGLLRYAKRKRGRRSVHESIDDVITLLRPFLELREVTVDTSGLTADQCTLFTSKAALESIFTNVTINSLTAFTKSHTANRRIVFESHNVRNQLHLTVADNGPGIRDLDEDEIWLPGKTTTENGTGLGLTIVRDVVQELNGATSVTSNGSLGGASFEIILPIR